MGMEWGGWSWLSLLAFFFPFFSVGFPLSVYLVNFNGEWKCNSEIKAWSGNVFVYVFRNGWEDGERCFQLKVSHKAITLHQLSGYNCKIKWIFEVCFLNFGFSKSGLDCKAKKKKSKTTIGMQKNTYYKTYWYYFNSEVILQSSLTVFAKTKN